MDRDFLETNSLETQFNGTTQVALTNLPWEDILNKLGNFSSEILPRRFLAFIALTGAIALLLVVEITG